MLAVNTYHDRVQAGSLLAQRLAHYRRAPNVLVLGLPRGGVPVAFQVAKFLHAPLDVFLVRKLGMPGHEEFAIGAIASGGVRLLNQEVVDDAGLAPSQIEAVTQRESLELARREQLYRGARKLRPIAGRCVIVVDDGVATGFSIRAAALALQQYRPARVVIATPVGAPDTCEELAADADEPVCPLRPSPFQAVGLWYSHFEATTDGEVQTCLRDAERLKEEGAWEKG